MNKTVGFGTMTKTEKTIGFGTMTKTSENGLTKIELTGYTGRKLYAVYYDKKKGEKITADEFVSQYISANKDLREHRENYMIADIYSPKDADFYGTFCGAYLDNGTFIIADNFIELRAKAKAEGGYLRQAYIVRDSFWKAHCNRHRHDTYQQFLDALLDQKTRAMRPMTVADLLSHLPKEEVEA